MLFCPCIDVKVGQQLHQNKRQTEVTAIEYGWIQTVKHVYS